MAAAHWLNCTLMRALLAATRADRTAGKIMAAKDADHSHDR